MISNTRLLIVAGFSGAVVACQLARLYTFLIAVVVDPRAYREAERGQGI